MEFVIIYLRRVIYYLKNIQEILIIQKLGYHGNIHLNRQQLGSKNFGRSIPMSRSQVVFLMSLMLFIQQSGFFPLEIAAFLIKETGQIQQCLRLEKGNIWVGVRL